MRERNWQQYNKQLIQRGSLTFLINPKMFKALSKPPKSKGRGRPIQYSQSVIELLLTVKVHFKLTYRSLQGFAEFFCSSSCLMKKSQIILLCVKSYRIRQNATLAC
ncbi:MAG: transposase [Parachlamydiaceae bacterium]|nr:MAG: transposase [Parachlamydiaceae bacterium]